ncbi:WYL domain-containing protein [Agromyces sp. G08B096]|uniref:WYL domain-containing protein n=1 Tax=Agromyces sp. G08B096 TaxID=3156399 RepID=A0AAU7W7F7_9MICO
MNRTDRLYALREELRRAGEAGRTAERLAETFEVSVRTVKRDISSLQQGGFPVWARPGPGGGYVVDRHATLPPANFTESEIAGLAAAVSAHRGQPFEQHARLVLTKALGLLGAAARTRAEALTSRVWIDADSEASEAAARGGIERALSEMRIVSLRVRDRDGGLTEHRVDPILLARTRGHWYFVGHSDTVGAIRWFRLDRIDRASPTSEPASGIPVSEVGAPPATAAPLSAF